MNVHRNAKTTMKMRQLIATRARQGGTYAQIADALGLSVRTVAKWIARAQQDALTDGSSRPHHQPRRTSRRVEAMIVALRRTRATAWQISTALRMPRSTVTRHKSCRIAYLNLWKSACPLGDASRSDLRR